MTTIVFYKGHLYTDTLGTTFNEEDEHIKTRFYFKIKKYLFLREKVCLAWSGHYHLGRIISSSFKYRLPLWLFPRLLLSDLDAITQTTMMLINLKNNKLKIVTVSPSKICKVTRKLNLFRISYKYKTYKISDGSYYAIGSGTDYVGEWHDQRAAAKDEVPNFWVSDAIKYAASKDIATNDDVQIIDVARGVKLQIEDKNS